MSTDYCPEINISTELDAADLVADNDFARDSITRTSRTRYLVYL